MKLIVYMEKIMGDIGRMKRENKEETIVILE